MATWESIGYEYFSLTQESLKSKHLFQDLLKQNLQLIHL